MPLSKEGYFMKNNNIINRIARIETVIENLITVMVNQKIVSPAAFEEKCFFCIQKNNGDANEKKDM